MPRMKTCLICGTCSKVNDIVYENMSHTWHLFKSQWCSIWKHVAYAAPVQKSIMQHIETRLICGTYSKVNDAAYGNMSHTQHLFKSQWCSIWKHVAYVTPVQKSMMQHMETCHICGIYSKVNDAVYENMSHMWHLFKSQWCSVWKHVTYAAPIQKSIMQHMEKCCIRGICSKVNDATYGNMFHTWHLFKSQWCSIWKHVTYTALIQLEKVLHIDSDLHYYTWQHPNNSTTCKAFQDFHLQS